MKKITIFTLFLLFICGGAIAQVVPFNGKLSEALAKASKEDKNVVVMCSASW